MSALRDPYCAAALLRALAASAAAMGCDVKPVSADTRGWASATYVGARHLVVLTCAAGVARYRWLVSLAEADLPLVGHVALPPAIVSADGERVTLEVIVLEDH